MAETAHAATDGAPRRDFLKLVTGAFAAVGVGAIAWPFIASLQPAKDTLALASTDVDLGPITEGQAITVMWRGKPVFVRNRTAKEVQEARAVPTNSLPDPATDQSRVQKDQWLILVGICTHLGCVPTGQRATDARAITAAGSAPAMAAITTRQAEFAKDRRPGTLSFRNTPLHPTPRSESVEDRKTCQSGYTIANSRIRWCAG